jgi:hypothetical protein
VTLNPGLSTGGLEEITFTAWFCCLSPLADRVDDLGVGFFLALYVPLRPDAALLVKLKTEPITPCDEVLSAEGKLQHPGGDAPVDLLHVGTVAVTCLTRAFSRSAFRRPSCRMFPAATRFPYLPRHGSMAQHGSDTGSCSSSVVVGNRRPRASGHVGSERPLV